MKTKKNKTINQPIVHKPKGDSPRNHDSEDADNEKKGEKIIVKKILVCLKELPV